MKFSILIPAYKPDFLKECIDSVLSQSFIDFELIIVNDASPYDLESIINSYHDERIKYYRNKENHGALDLVHNWNLCLGFASGEYVINMGDDDILLPNCLENYVNLIGKYPGLDAYHTRTIFINDKSECIDLQEERPEYESVYSMIWHFWKGRRQRMGDWLFKTESLRANGGYVNFPCAWGSDDITAFMMATEKGVANCREFGFGYRDSLATITNNSQLFVEKANAWLEIKTWYIDFLKNEPQNNLDAYYHKFLNLELNSYIKRKIKSIIKKSTKKNISMIKVWFPYMDKFGINKLYLFFAATQSLLNKI